MSSVLRPVRKRKKSRKLGPVDVIRREDYGDLELDAKVELIRSLVPLGLMHVEEMLDDEVTALAGARYARKDASIGGRRHGSNPGTVGLAGQRVPIRVPRIRRVAGGEISLRSCAALHGERAVNDRLLTRGFCCKVWDHARESVGWTSLRGQSEHLVDQLRLPDHVALRHPSRLSLAERMHDLDAAQGPPRRGESLEAQHRPGAAFDESVVLLDDVVQIFALAKIRTRSDESLVSDGLERDRVGLEFVIRPPLEAGPCPGSGRSNAHG